jgi:hypothetical protein
MDLFFWLLLSLGVPLVGRLFALGLPAFTHGSCVARQLIVESVKDGQLLWSTISLCATGIYEVITTLEARGATPVLELSTTLYCLIACGCSVLVMMATTAGCEKRSAAQSCLQHTHVQTRCRVHE